MSRKSPLFGATTTKVYIGDLPKVTEGENFIARVEISDVKNFDACNYDVLFDATVLKLENITDGKIDSTSVPVDIWSELRPGKLRIVQNIPGIAGVSGSGYLAELHFCAIGSEGASSHINLSNGVLANNMAEMIPATWTGASVQVQNPKKQ